MRLVIALVLAFGFAAPAAAQTAASSEVHGSETQPTYQQNLGPSGFWTSPYPAKNGADRYRLLGIGCALVLGMGLVTWRLVKRANTFRAERDAAAKKPVET